MASSRAQQTQELNDIRALSLKLHFYTSNPTSSDTGTEVTGGGYTPQTVTFAAPVTDGLGTSISNDAVVTFGPATGDWSSASPVTHFGIRVDGGRLVQYGELTSLGIAVGRVVRAGDYMQFPAGIIKIRKPD